MLRASSTWRRGPRLRSTRPPSSSGGDEFAVASAPETPPDHASRLAQRLVDAVADPIALEDTFITVGASVGLATATTEHVVHQADAALYRAKATRPHHTHSEPTR